MGENGDIIVGCVEVGSGFRSWELSCAQDTSRRVTSSGAAIPALSSASGLAASASTSLDFAGSSSRHPLLQRRNIQIMGKEDYASTGTSPPQRRAAFRTNTQEGGSLKLKGAKDSGIKKKKKKSRDKALTEAKSENPEGERAISAAEENESDRGKARESEGAGEPDGDDDDGVETGAYYAGKTDAERRFEERKRKRVSGGGESHFPGRGLTIGQMDERLKREGTKSHKQRVEEYNKYLSNLSEHHDMYVSLHACFADWEDIVTNALGLAGRVSDLANTWGEREGGRGRAVGFCTFILGRVCSYQRHGIPERQDNAVFVTVTR